MVVPLTIQDYIRLILAVILVIGAIYLQVTTADIPEWLFTGIAAIVAYYFGLSSNSRDIRNNEVKNGFTTNTRPDADK